ncbi:MAG: hypothetical protein JWL99_4659, partial [Streptomyces oryziradicis]|nr:hypothetical protein [Actinacidiphila oryziradicis]
MTERLAFVRKNALAVGLILIFVALLGWVALEMWGVRERLATA